MGLFIFTLILIGANCYIFSEIYKELKKQYGNKWWKEIFFLSKYEKKLQTKQEKESCCILMSLQLKMIGGLKTQESVKGIGGGKNTLINCILNI